MQQRTCIVESCARPLCARGYCDGHYRRWRKGDVRESDPLEDFSGVIQRTCTLPECPLRHYANGLCAAHWRRTRRGVSFAKGIRPRQENQPPDTVCLAAGCARRHYAKGYCKSHYGIWRMENLAADARAAKAERDRAWREANRIKTRGYTAKADATRRNRPRLDFTADELCARMAYWGNRCWVCAGPFEAIDHVKPLAKGGWHALANLRPICRTCNSRKHARWPITPALIEAIRERRAPL